MLFRSFVTITAILTVSYAHSVEIVTSMPQQGIDINTRMIKAIFSGKAKYWPDGTPIKVITQPKDSSQHLNLCKDILKVHPRQFSRNWDIVLFSGFGEKPILVESDQEVLEKIKSTNGSIGYVNTTSEEGGIYVIQIK